MMKNLILCCCLLASSLSVISQNNLPYLGQDPPGMTVNRFPPDSLLGNSNWWWHGPPVFSADGLEMFWTEYVRHSPTNEQPELFAMKVENNNWGPVHHPGFSNQNYMENNPVLSITGDTMYFLSTRPGGPYFMTKRTASGWTQPSPVDIPVPSGCSSGWQFAVNAHGDFYIELSCPPTAPPDLYVSKLWYGNYQMAEKLGPEVNTDYLEAFPFADPAGDYLIFSSNRPGMTGTQFDMYICFRDEEGNWTEAMNMGPEINATGAWFGAVTQDKQFLFFNTWRTTDAGYNPYWISAAIIDSLETAVSAGENRDAPSGVLLYQNEPNPFRGETVISFRLDQPAEVTLVVYDHLGREVATILSGERMQAGKHAVTFSAEKHDLPSGIYTCALIADNRTIVKKMILAR
jgi:hypothetical protein